MLCRDLPTTVVNDSLNEVTIQYNLSHIHLSYPPPRLLFSTAKKTTSKTTEH